MKTKEKARIDRKQGEAIEALQGFGVDFETAESYGEQGYTADHGLIILANWNDIPKGLIDFVESVAEIEWSDEWIIDYGSGRAFRCQPDSYGWQRAWFEYDGEIVPWDSLPEDGESLAESLRYYGFIASKGDSCIHGIPGDFISTQALEGIATLALDDLQSGFHHGQTDSPEKALESLPPGGYLFRISGVGQFDVTFQAWRLKEGIEVEVAA